jgi:hypothetical protein
MTIVTHRPITIPRPAASLTWPVVAEALAPHCGAGEVPLRLALVDQRADRLTFEVTLVERLTAPEVWGPLWRFHRRARERTRRFVAVHVIPTGVRAEIGGFAGDGTPAANLLASACDHLLTHPNAVTASDLYCARDNVLYVEGNLLSRFLLGQLHLVPGQVRRIGVLVDRPASDDLLHNVLNAVHAARSVGGLRVDPVWVSEVALRARVFYGESGRALGEIDALDRLLDIARRAEGLVDALAITSAIEVSPALRRDYYAGKPIANPWGGVEATLTHAVTSVAGLPAAHAPMLTSWADTRVDGPVDPRDAAEVISTSYLLAVLRGLANAPTPIAADRPWSAAAVERLTLEDVGAIVLPAGAMGGIPAFAALAQGIPIIAVTENRTLSPITLPDIVRADLAPEVYVAANYVEAAGLLLMLRERIGHDTLRRPLAPSRPLPR